MARKSTNDSKIARERQDLEMLLDTLPSNPIPWAGVVRLVTPLVARLAVRYALKKAGRALSEDRVNIIGRQVGDFIGDIIAKRTGSEGGTPSGSR